MILTPRGSPRGPSSWTDVRAIPTPAGTFFSRSSYRGKAGRSSKNPDTPCREQFHGAHIVDQLLRRRVPRRGRRRGFGPQRRGAGNTGDGLLSQDGKHHRLPVQGNRGRARKGPVRAGELRKPDRRHGRIGGGGSPLYEDPARLGGRKGDGPDRDRPGRGEGGERGGPAGGGCQSRRGI